MDKAGLMWDRLGNKGIIVTFPTPSPVVCKKYQLAAQGDMAHVVCMPHLIKEIICAFVKDMVIDRKDFTQ